MYASDIEIRPQSGWANIQLGSTLTEVRTALATNGHAYDLADNELTIDIHSPQTTFFFDDSEPKQLVQIVFSDPDHRINNQPIIGLTLAEGLIAVRPKSYEDTLWSLVSIEEEYPKGQPLEDSKRIRKSSGQQNLECGTLWVLSQDVGLVMLDGLVHEVAIRRPGEAPTVGCGRLDSHTMEMALNAKPTLKKAESPYPQSLKLPKAVQVLTNRSSKRSVAFRAVFSLLAVNFLALPILIVYRDLTAWQHSIATQGVVVDTRFEGPFLEEVFVEYSVAGDSTKHRVSIPASYTTAQEVGKEVELLYLKDQPQRAMTRIQTRDEGWSISPYLLFGSIALAAFLSHLAFPEFVRFGKRRSVRS